MARLRIVGAGLAGLAAAVAASRPGGPWREILVEEAAPQAGGRCRSFEDPAFIEPIDNGVHVLLSANRAARRFLAETGAPEDGFAALAPPWRFARPDGRRAGLGERLQSLATAAFNTEWEALPGLAAPGLALRALAGPAMLVPRRPLSELFVHPALRLLEGRGVRLRFSSRATELDERPTILALPPREAARLLPGLAAPEEHRAIVTTHFACPGVDAPAALGIVGGLGFWLFRRRYGLSAVASAADELTSWPAETVAAACWEEIGRVLGHREPLPPWRVVKERRATIAFTRANLAHRRPPAPCHLAGDWTAAGLPATIEAAVRSGFAAARAATLQARLSYKSRQSAILRSPGLRRRSR